MGARHARTFTPYCRAARAESGSAAVVAVAVIVIVGFIGSWLVSVVVLRNTSLANRALATQAYYIADAGTEWACAHASGTPSPVSFGGGTFTLVQNGEVWDSVATAGQAKCTIRCDQSPNPPSTSVGDGGIEYVLRSRMYDYWATNVDFLITNTSNAAITFTSLKVTWSSPAAYFEQISMRVVNGTNYNTLWHYNNDSPKYRWASGEKKDLNRHSSVTIPDHYTAELHFLDFSRNRSGSSGGELYMGGTTVTVEFYNGSTKVGEITVGPAPT